MYADDIVLVANTEDKLQAMLNVLHEWCKRWRVLINTNKSKCMHFRKGRTQQSKHVFKIGQNSMETVETYKYLGVTFHEKNDFTQNAESLSKGAGRALGVIINTIHHLKDFGFKAFEKLFTSCVVPILDYGASSWGYRQFQSIDNVQNRALRYFLGVHRFAPILALHGDTGWVPSVYRRWHCMLRFWNRLITMDDARLTKRAFLHDYNMCTNNWCSDIKKLFCDIGMSLHYDNKTVIDLSTAKQLIKTLYENKWKHDMQNTPKLRTYKTLKN